MSISTTETEPVDTILDILDQASNDPSYWTNQAPEVFYYWDKPFSEKGPGADMPPRVYVWSPTSTDTPRFSADGDEIDTTSTVSIQIWTLDERESKELQTDIVQLQTEYHADNKVKTDWQDIWPQNTSDFREQKPARQTQHYVSEVEVELRKLDQAQQRANEDTTFTFAFDSGFA